MTKVTGGKMLAHMLAAEGVDTVFGIPDGTYLRLIASLSRCGIRLVTPRHETSAVHMAGAYSRLTGKLGVCIASNGPGVANALPGVVVENAEGNRVLLLTSCRRRGIVYPDRGGAYQCFDQVAATAPITRWSGVARSPERIPEMMHKALRAAYQGRPGVVHVDVPEDVINGSFDFDLEGLPAPPRYRVASPPAPSSEDMEAAASILSRARRPIIHAGSGVIHSGAYAELAAAAERLQAPVTTSWSARAVLPETHPLAVPMIYPDEVTRVRNEADAVLVIGSRLGETDWWGKPPYWRAGQQVIQVDIDEEVFGLNRPASLAIRSDARAFLQALACLEKRPNGEHAAWIAAISGRKREARCALDKALSDKGSPMSSAHVAAVCRRVLDDDAILVVDGGNTTVWASYYHEVRAVNTLLSTFKFGMLGAGVSQAMGAQVAFPGRQVCCIIGDGAMGFHVQEIETAVRHGLPVTYVVVCDRQWGMVKMTQQFVLKPLKTMVRKSLGPRDTINADLSETAFDRLAESMGARGVRVDEPLALESAMREAVVSDRCTVIHVDVDPVRHMWAPGLATFKRMHQEPR
jgi:acetolactate synthase I/II/III large subunit